MKIYQGHCIFISGGTVFTSPEANVMVHLFKTIQVQKGQVK